MRVLEKIKPVLEVFAWIFVIFVVPAIWIVYDGLNDTGRNADVALVTSPVEPPSNTLGPLVQSRLDVAAGLYQKGAVPLVIVAGKPTPDGRNEASLMSDYLQQHQVPVGSIIEDHQGNNIQEMTRNVAETVRQRKLQTVMVVSSYYHITWVEMALKHEGVPSVEKRHVGTLSKDDVWPIGREVVAGYIYIGRTYVIPGVRKALKEAKDGIDKALLGAQKAKNGINSGLESMPQ